MKHKHLLFSIALAVVLSACEDDQVPSKVIVPEAPVERIEAPDFQADSAYSYIQQQVDFGPRVPNTPEHLACGHWLVDRLKSYGAEVTEQKATVIAWDGTPLNMRNIIGAFAPEKRKRVLLYAHWDTRPYADKDSTRMQEPIDGANDGGSGVGVLLEVARLIQLSPPNVGVDIIFFDTEDYGPPEWVDTGERSYLQWCLGSQYWSQNKHTPNYRAKYGILLDMVGGKDAVFHKEGTSMAFAPNIVELVWGVASDLGYSDRFRDKVTPQTIDDNYFVSAVGGIPSANIVEYHVDVLPMGYGIFHHTHLDNMSIIDTTTLQIVGDVVMETVYRE